MASGSDPWRVLIVEDDATVAQVHGELVAAIPGFAVVAVATTAAEAERILATLGADLLLLDLGLPGGDGVSLLRRLRARRDPVEAIAVTAANQASVVRTMLHLGALDYLVKPFDPERLHDALRAFDRRMASLRQGVLEQTQVDQVRGGRPRPLPLPRDLNDETLARVGAALAAAGRPMTAQDVGSATGLARVTVRRYLEYLVTVGRASVDAEPTGPGRPRKAYAAVHIARVGHPRTM